MRNGTSSVSVARTWSLLITSTASSVRMSAPVTAPLTFFSIRSTRVWALEFLTISDLTLSTMSVTSSTTPGSVVNSCWAPWSLICVIALPSRLESRIRRRLLPIVTPKPRSKGSATNLPYVGVNVAVSHVT